LRCDVRPRPSHRYQGTDLGDEYLFYDSGDETVHVLNGSAREIYMLCDGTRSEQDVAQAFSTLHEVDRDRAERDALETIRQMCDLGLLVDDEPRG
jgi:hypothetical protein